MKTIRISHEDAVFMLRVLELPSALKLRLESCPTQGTELNDDEADELRDLCGERLQTHGFDDKYDPTDEGVKLESLIDKLFVG